MGLEELFWFSH